MDIKTDPKTGEQSCVLNKIERNGIAATMSTLTKIMNCHECTDLFDACREGKGILKSILLDEELCPPIPKPTVTIVKAEE